MSQNTWKVYIQPFTDFGIYSGVWQDVTKYVDFSSLGSVASSLDNTDYDIGVYRNSNFKLTLNNKDGSFSDVDNPKSIFKYKRSNSLCRVTWEIDPDSVDGYAIADRSFLSEEQDIFIGLLSDESLVLDLDTQQVSFNVLGRESIFLSTLVPFATVSNGMLLSTVLYAVLNQPSITSLLTVSQVNIVPGIDYTIDSIASLQNQSVQEGLNNLLLATNSVLYIANNTLYITARTPTADVKFNFYGQASTLGRENIQNLKNIKNGLAKVFNYFTWNNTTLAVQDSASVTRYGARTKALNFEFVVDTTKRQNVMNSLLSEFANPKQEFDIYTSLNYSSLAIPLLGRCSIDYPSIFIESGVPIPICGLAVAGVDILPKSLWSFIVPATDNYKLIGKSLNIKTGIYTFRMRLI